MTEQEVTQALSTVVPVELGVDLVTAKAVRAVRWTPQALQVHVCLGYPFEGVRDEYERQIREALAPLLGERELMLELDHEIVAHRVQEGLNALDQVSNVIAVASGKGGVGKSTTAVNLALALRAEGARVGLLDADIFGPSQPLMLGVAEGTRPETLEERWFVPVQAHGLQTMSMGYLVDEHTAVIMRGPKASGALRQLVTWTRWQALDYLIVDMPPGTSDLQMTLGQQVPVAGALVVTTPQDIALLDARKGIEMFSKVDVSVLGVVENMAMHRCSNCGHVEHIFGEGGGERIAELYQVPLLGSLPLALSIREQADGGTPSVVAAPEGEEARLYRQAARNAAARLSLQPRGERGFPPVVNQHRPR